jgi:hypothetical protein
MPMPTTNCYRCRGPVDVKTKHVAIEGSAVRFFCSESCRDGSIAVVEPPVAIEPTRRRIGWLLVTALALAGGLWYWLRDEVGESATVEAAAPGLPIFTIPAMLPAVHPATAPAPKGPTPEELQAAEDAALIAELGKDAWIHPLVGPMRRMPANHNGAFGALRDNNPPPECLSGHCGVDVGREWGEPVHAVHDGVVDWVNRGPNEENGGVFVKIAHRGGSLYSWYFHLAAVPRWVQPGAKVSVGQVIGLLGDTGVKHSAPHLHFAMTVKTGKNRERYIDPEPLLALWPLWIIEGGKGHISTDPSPGVPVRGIPAPKHVPEAQLAGSETPVAPPVAPVEAPAAPALPEEPAPAPN